MSTQKYIGRALQRFEDLRLVRGAGQYTDDFAFEDQVYAVFVRSPYAHARVVAVSTVAAKAQEGVLAVLTATDYTADGHGPIVHAAPPTDALDPRKPAFNYTNGQPPIDEPHWPLASDTVSYVGEAVAMVIATSAALAHDAAEAVQVEYTPLEPVIDVANARVANVAVDGEHGAKQATEHALEHADLVVEHTFRSQRIANAQLEPRAAIGVYDADHDSYLMVAGSQGVTRQHAALAGALNIPAERIRVICPDVGGGFGPRSYLYAEQALVVWAARRVGRPVRWTSTRSEAFVSDYQGRDSLVHVRVGFQNSGRISALAADCLYDIGAHTIGGYVPIANFSRILTSVYDIPYAWLRVRGVRTNTAPTGPYRGAGRPEAMFVIERLLDLAAAKMHIDRVELRRRNLIQKDQLPYATPLGLRYDSGDFAHNLERALELADWHGFPARQTAARTRGKLAGIGVANYVEAPVGAPFERVAVRTRPDARVVELVSGTQSSGQGHETTFAQVAADLLGIRPDQVKLITGDTQVVRSGGGTHSDRSMRLAGTLIVQACADVQAKTRQLAAQQLEVSVDDLVFEDGSFTAAGTDRRVSLFDVGSVSAEATFVGRIPAHPTGAAVCEVEVDPQTGAVSVTRYTAVDDVGQPINPLILHGQVAGGIVQGLGQALSEHAAYQPGTGQLTTGSFLDYALLRAADLPTFALELDEDPTPGNPLRVKGGGESGITPSLAAAVNAIADATGQTELTMPVTAAQVWTSGPDRAQHPGRQ